MYFSYGSEFSFECHKTAEEAIAAAEAAIDDYRGDACDGWSEEVESICWGVIIQQATKVGERKKRKCDRVSPWIERVCDYELRPNVETSATDAFLDEIERKAIRKFINSIEHILRDKLSPYDTEEMLEAMRIFLEEQGGEQK
ncbi:hNH endonuclease [Escherichia coli]|uniref:hNH endonuclease n=1 Tax=Escherichia coli TaxID=562 RepID=UPI003D7893D6